MFSTVEQLATVVDLDKRPPGFRTVLEIDLAMHGPMTRRTARRLNQANYETMPPDDANLAPGDWVQSAACKGQRMFYATYQAHSGYRMTQADRDMERAALATCRECPVMVQCRMWALQEPDPAVDHVAGGMTPRQRWQWRRTHR